MRADSPVQNVDLDWRNLRTLGRYVLRHKASVGLALVLLVLAKVATVLVPLVLKRLVDALDGANGLVVVPLGLLAAYGALRFSTSFFRELESIVFAHTSLAIAKELSRDVLSHLHALSLRFHLARKTGAVARDIERGTSSIGALLSYTLFNVVPTLVEVGLVTAILVKSYGASLALVALVTFLTYVAYTLALTKWRSRYRRLANDADSRASTQAIDSLINAETVKYFGNESYEVRRYGEALVEWERASRKSQSSLALLNLGQGGVIALGVAVLLYLASRGVADGEMTLGDFVAVNALLLQLFVPLGFLGSVYGALRQSLIDMQRMFELLDTKPEVADREGARSLPSGPGHVRFERVHFAYDPERPILRDVDLELRPGQKVAVVGPSGAGKSTLARLLFRLYDVTGGRITIDGHDLRDISQASLRAAIGVVPQDTVLFNETLHYNVAYGRLGATREEIDRAVEQADLATFVKSLPQGLETLVGERGLKLSGGEKQRVAIARALLKAPPLLIFDEATSSLDSASERAILGALAAAAKKHTSLVIAHRLSTVVDADEIVVLDQGRIVERGVHHELLERGGLYARLWRMQEQREREPA